MAATLGTRRIKKAAHQERIVDASDQSENPEWRQPSAPAASKKQRIRNGSWTLPTNLKTQNGSNPRRPPHQKSSPSGTDRGRFRPI
jgi:hypothetical protein